ncbi:MAG: sugar phosphate isomerase/epimerase family protein [Planctomycetota bacterium]
MPTLEIGVLVPLTEQPDDEIRKVAELGLRSCQVCSWDTGMMTDAVGEALLKALRDHDVRVSTFWAGYSGPEVWDFIEGPATIGLVPPAYRAQRVADLKHGVAFAAGLGFPSITTHVGFIPENPSDPNYDPTVEAVGEVASRCSELGIGFNFETGQETPVTLLRTIERVGLDNLGINLDAANLILYGKGNPVDALDVFGRYVRDVHAKDGKYPTDGDHLGAETPLGDGRVDFAALVAKLKELGYTGPLTIEREISGPKQIEDIKRAIELLRPLC